MMRNRAGLLVSLLVCSFAQIAQAAPPATNTPPVPPPPASGAKPPVAAQKIDVDSLKQKYWAKGNETQLEVVQNRIYTKRHKLELQGMYGTFGHDPFLNSSILGGGVGFYFSEYIELNAFYWKLNSSQSTAYTKIVEATGRGTNSNPVLSLVGAELTGAVLYGKLSLIGKAILHFDLLLHAGAGQLTTTNNTAIAPWLGIGGQLFLTTWLSFHADYRVMRYTENIVELFDPDKLNTVIGTRTTYGGAFTVGLGVLLF